MRVVALEEHFNVPAVVKRIDAFAQMRGSEMLFERDDAHGDSSGF